MSGQAGYRINEPNVSSEEIDGEVIIVNLLNGNYYSAQDMGAYVWGRISHGESLDTMQTALCQRFAGNDTTIHDTRPIPYIMYFCGFKGSDGKLAPERTLKSVTVPAIANWNSAFFCIKER